MKKLLYFSAEWCGPCKTLGPIVDSLSGQINNDKIDVRFGLYFMLMY